MSIRFGAILRQLKLLGLTWLRCSQMQQNGRRRPIGPRRQGCQGVFLRFQIVLYRQIRWVPRATIGGIGRGQEGSSFLKKRSKKLLIAVADLSPAPTSRHKSFLLLFFKKEGLTFLTFQWVFLPIQAFCAGGGPRVTSRPCGGTILMTDPDAADW